MDIFAVKSEEIFFIKNKNPKESSKYEETRRKESLSVEDLYEIPTNGKNSNLLTNLKITDNKQQNILFTTDDKENIILETNNKKEIFSVSISNDKPSVKKIKEEIKERTNMTIKTFSDDSETTEQFALNGKKLSEEVVNHKDNSREYTEFHKFGNIKLKMQVDSNGKQNYILEKYGKDKNLAETMEPFYEDGDDFETVKDNNILGHKQKFSLTGKKRIEKDFRKFGIVTNENRIQCFNESFNKSYNKLKNNIDENVEELSIFRNIEIIKNNFSTLKKIRNKIEDNRTISEYSVKIGEKEINFEIEEARIFDDKDKLKVEISEDGELKFKCDNISFESGGKYYFTVPDKDGSIYLFDKNEGRHHSNFSWDKERNSSFSVVASGLIILDNDYKIAKITNHSGHFKPIAKDSTESLLRVLAKNIVLVLKEKGLDVKFKGIEDLLSKDKKIGNEGYNISVDKTKCESKSITLNSEEPQATTTISKRRLNLIDENARNSIMSRGV